MLEKLKSYLQNDASEFHTRLPILIRNLCTGKKPSNSEVDQLVNLAEKYTLANHLFWGLWGLISVCFFFLFFILVRCCCFVCYLYWFDVVV